GDPLDKPIRDVVPAYYEKLGLGDKNIAMSKRGEILDLHWGRIEQDGAALNGLGLALENLSGAIDANVREVGKQWSGESFDAFRTAMDKIRTTLDAYSAAAKKVGGILLEAMTQARSMYQDYASATQQSLSFTHMPPPDQWHKMDERTGVHLASVCVVPPPFCKKDDGAVTPILKDQFATTHQLASCEAESCEMNLERVRLMYTHLVRSGKDGREKIRKIVHDWCGATDQFKENVESVLKIAVDNVHALARSQAFSSLKVVGGTGDGQPTGGGDPGSDSGGSPAPGGGYPDGGAAVEPIVEPTTTPEPSPEPAPEPDQAQDAAAAEPPADPSEPTPPTDPAADPGAVTINDGDRTIGVSDKGEGHVNVTVTDASGTTRTYDLDFDAASGLLRSADGQPAPEGVEQVPARTDGKCVFQDGDVTITAQRPLFAPDQITLTVDDGTGKPTTYTVEFPDTPADAQPPATEAGAGDTAGAGSTDSTAGAGNTAGAGTTAGADSTVRAGTTAGADGAIPSGADPAAAAPATDSTAIPTHSATGTTGTAPPLTPTSASDPTSDSTSETGTRAAPAAAFTSDQANQLTSPQSAWSENARGSVSGVLSPDHPNGEAVLAAAPDDAQPDTGGMIGAGLPMIGHPGGGNAGEVGRAGSGWSVHGDLFDTGEPVHSMHGVLGDGDFERTDR
ncbi:MAG: hypothetical protein ACJ73U_30975, partial [Actinophytocola sp.]